MKKRYLASLIAIVMIMLTVFAPFGEAYNVYAAGNGTAKISVENVKANAGDTVEVAISLSNNPGVIGLRISVEYEAGKLDLIDAVNGNVFAKNAAVFGNDLDASPFILSWDESLAQGNINANGKLAVLKFKVNSSDAQIKVQVKDLYDYDLNDVSCSVTNGRIYSGSPTTSTTAGTSTTTKTTAKTTASKTTAKTTAKTTKKTTTTTAKLPDIDVKITRLSGSDRIQTAVEISKSGWKKADNVVLAYAMNYPDALAGAPLAHALNAPILLTANKGSLESSVLKEIERLGAKNVYILGGKSAVSDKIAGSLRSQKLSVERISGSSRYGTAVAIAEKLVDVTGKKPAEVFVVSGVNFPDALSVSSIAALKKCPILFAPATGSIDGATSNFIKSCKTKDVYLLGGTAAVSDGVKSGIKSLGVNVVRISGSDRYATALAVYRKFDKVFKGDGVVIATGANFPDALAGGAYAAKKSVPVILVGNSVSSEMKKYVKSGKPDSAVVLGGENAVSQQVAYSMFA